MFALVRCDFVRMFTGFLIRNISTLVTVTDWWPLGNQPKLTKSTWLSLGNKEPLISMHSCALPWLLFAFFSLLRDTFHWHTRTVWLVCTPILYMSIWRSLTIVQSTHSRALRKTPAVPLKKIIHGTPLYHSHTSLFSITLQINNT